MQMKIKSKAFMYFCKRYTYNTIRNKKEKYKKNMYDQSLMVIMTYVFYNINF